MRGNQGRIGRDPGRSLGSAVQRSMQVALETVAQLYAGVLCGGKVATVLRGGSFQGGQIARTSSSRFTHVRGDGDAEDELRLPENRNRARAHAAVGETWEKIHTKAGRPSYRSRRTSPRGT